MQVVGTVAGIVGAGVAFVGVFWAVVFGPRNVVDLMAARQGTRGTAKVAVATASKVPRGAVRGTSKPTPPAPSRYKAWLAVTGRLVLECWEAYGEFDWGPYERMTLPIAAGLAMRIFLVLAPGLAFFGTLFTGIGLVVPQGDGSLQFGLVLLVGFLTAFLGEFFLIGIMGLIGLFFAVMPAEAFKDKS